MRTGHWMLTVMFKVFRLIDPSKPSWECWTLIRLKSYGGICCLESSWWMDYCGLCLLRYTGFTFKRFKIRFTTLFPYLWLVILIQLLYSDFLVHLSLCVALDEPDWPGSLRLCKGMCLSLFCLFTFVSHQFSDQDILMDRRLPHKKYCWL